MTQQEAETVRKMIAGHWNLRMDDPTSELWLAALIEQDAQEATAAVAHMARRMHYAPKIVDFREVIRLLNPPAETPVFDGVPEYKFGVQAPEWVWVWSWARWRRDPSEERPFPQQDGHVDGTETMSRAEYDELLAEWKKAGSPKEKSPLPVSLGS